MPKVKKPKPGVIRAGAVRANVYNEGLCVYLHDEANAEKLRAMMADKKKYPRCDPKKTFFENLSDTKFATDAAAAGLALAYTLDQDDEISVEIAVGEPLRDDELAIACWLEPQRARIALPTGRLRIDSPNTMPLDHDEKIDAGAIVEVPHGDYVLTLYRVDWDELRRSGKRYKGPQEFILLTPAKKSARPSNKQKLEGPILKWTPRREPSPGAVRAKKSKEPGGEFACKLIFLGYWENYGVNFTRAGAAKMGLEPGARLRFTIEKFVLDALYLGDMTPTDFIRFHSKDRVERETSPFKEFALSEWTSMPGREFLAFRRIQAKKCVPERLIDKWFPAKGVLLPDPWEIPRAAAVGEPKVEKKTIRAGVTFSSTEEVALNLTAEQLTAIGAKPGDLLELSSEAGPTRTLFFGAGLESRDYSSVVTRALPQFHEEFYARINEGNPRGRFFAFPADRKSVV